MSRTFEVHLEYDGDNPIRNDFVCDIYDLNYSCLRDWEDLHETDLRKYSSKKDSLMTLERSTGQFGPFPWGIGNIVRKIESVKRELELDTQLNAVGKQQLECVIDDLQRLYDIAMENCKKNNLNPEKCYLVWWINC